MRKGTKHTKDYRGSIEERFWDKVNKTDTCWLWTAAINDAGYGLIRFQGKNTRAHRYSYQIHKGEVPRGVFVCHSCDIPACVNPQHLWLGTNQDNVNDMVKKTRHTLGSKNARAKLTEANVKALRELKSNGVKQADMARMLGISQVAVSQAITGKRWKHV